MKLVNTKDLLWKAYQEGYAVPAINVDMIDSVAGVLEVCEAMKAPVIIQLAPIQVHTKNISYETLINAIVEIAKPYNVTMSIHLDHGDDLEDIKCAAKSGFSSVMYDGSHHSFEENAKGTRIIRDYASDIGLEGELGVVGGNEGSSEDAVAIEDLYTNVVEAVKYVEETKVDFLAIAIGNAHGIYNLEPKLNFTRLQELNETLQMPLVLHGASGLKDEDIKTAISLGVSKINFFTDVDNAFVNGFLNCLEKNRKSYTFHCLVEAKKEMKVKVKNIIHMCGCAERIGD